MGYKPHRVTPYMHIMVYHVPYFIKKHGNIKMFSCQGMQIYKIYMLILIWFIKAVEKKNDDSKRVFFQSSNKINPTADMLKYQEQLSTLTSHEREKRTYKYEAICNMTSNYTKPYILAKKTVNIGKMASLQRERTREAFPITDTHMHTLIYSAYTHTYHFTYIATYHVEMCYMYIINT